jgi:hypothetical protein
VDVEFRPEPTAAEREALIKALERLLAGSSGPPSPYRSVWREAGIREAVEDQAAEARPRNNFGATRA